MSCLGSTGFVGVSTVGFCGVVVSNRSWMYCARRLHHAAADGGEENGGGKEERGGRRRALVHLLLVGTGGWLLWNLKSPLVEPNRSGRLDQSVDKDGVGGMRSSGFQDVQGRVPHVWAWFAYFALKYLLQIAQEFRNR